MFVYFFINKKIGILTLSSPMLSSEAISLDIMWIKLSYSFIIELNPTIIRFFYVTKVMTKVCRSIMKYNSLENIVIFWRRPDTFLMINCVWVDIEFLGELKSSVQFFIFKFIVVKLHSFQMDNEIVWNFCQKCTFCYIRFLFTSITLIVWNYFSINKFFQGLLDTFNSFDLKW